MVESGLFDDLGMPLSGMSITAPFKGSALAVAGAASPLVERIGAVNTLIRQAGVWEAEVTDPVGVLGRWPSGGSPSAIGRRRWWAPAAPAARPPSRWPGPGRGSPWSTAARSGGGRPRRRSGSTSRRWPTLTPLFEIVVQATPAGRGPDEEPPFDPARLAPGAVVIDLAYGEAPTPLVAAVRALGAGTVGIDGREVLLYQGLEQFRMMTGRELPAAVGRRLLGLGEEGS